MTQAVGEIKAVILQELPRLRRFAFSLTASKADADDLVQNAVVRMLKAGLPANAEVVPWMLRICKNLWIDEIRSREVRVKAADAISLESDTQVQQGEQQIQGRLDLQRVVRAMTTLSDNQRLALTLVAIDGMSYAEAAEVLDVPVGTIMSRVARARESLQKHFQHQAEEMTP
ncbi:RNA polymerase sigma factor [Exilibacterium tricleocarpae]|uniref:RNA polymerase sigma factor n=1 Tax=Exilibacterium tricleocarpae TaxID=2591008 RepID=A0A545U9T9_9GAMM|nr:RNA polymerase sigma factor [Exilibacterium tricleocarpae]TQV86238.1 RNA polymerase sigma factor [Exilibacterium tricleocarpae]